MPVKNDDLQGHVPLECIVIEPPQKANATLIGLHGLGASGEDFAAISSFLQFAPEWNVRMIFPHAPQIPITINHHHIMPAWYDIKKIDLDREIDQRMAEVSRQKILTLVEREIEKKIDSKRIILAGFSQGGAMAAEVALQCDKPLGGLAILSAYLLNEKKIQSEKMSPKNRDIPIFVGHGELDEIVPHTLAKRHIDLLQKKHYKVTQKIYKTMGHSVCPEEIKDLSKWLKQL